MNQTNLFETLSYVDGIDSLDVYQVQYLFCKVTDMFDTTHPKGKFIVALNEEKYQALVSKNCTCCNFIRMDFSINGSPILFGFHLEL